MGESNKLKNWGPGRGQGQSRSNWRGSHTTYKD